MGNPKKKFAKLYDKYVEKIYRYVFLKVGNSETAEDLTSQVFTKAWNKFKRPNKNIENPTAYLYQIARAEIANYYRGARKFKIISTETIQVADPQPTLEETQQFRSDIIELKNCLAKLSNDYQDVIIWRYIDGYSTKEIAKILKKPENTVRVLLHRALKELRGKMENL